VSVPNLAAILGFALAVASPAPVDPVREVEDYLLQPGDSLIDHEHSEIVADQCRRSLSRFCREAWKVRHPNVALEWSHHHDAICDHLQWLLESWIKKQVDPSYQQPAKSLAANQPPTSLKTELIMEFAPAWMWIRWPAWKVLCLSCNPRVALTSAVESRRLIESDWYRGMFKITWRLLDDQNSKSDFGNTEGGKRQSHGMSATVVGEHADAIFIDDPTDPKEVTRAALKKANDDWPSLRNRVNDERAAVRAIVQQRLDPEDLCGHVLKGRAGASWIHLFLPLEYEPHRACATRMPVNRKNRLELDASLTIGTWQDWRSEKGQLIQPVRYPPDVLEELKLTAGPYKWASQYQQDPKPRDGGTVKAKWIQFCKLAGHEAGTHARPMGFEDAAEAITVPRKASVRGGMGWDLDFLYLSIDPANKKTERGSLYGMLAVGGKGARRFVIDDRSQRGEWDEILKIICDMVRTWRPGKLLIEDTAAGPTLIRQLREQLSSGKLRADGVNVICQVQVLTPKEVGGDKEARLDGVINQISAGFLYVLEGAEWTEAFLEELTLFPNSPTKDRVDALTALLAITRVSLSSAWTTLFEDAPPDPAVEAEIIARTPAIERECQHNFLDGRCRLPGCTVGHDAPPEASAPPPAMT
jgi:predicted phage terminase large subunit-like protein